MRSPDPIPPSVENVRNPGRWCRLKGCMFAHKGDTEAHPDCIRRGCPAADYVQEPLLPQVKKQKDEP